MAWHVLLLGCPVGVLRGVGADLERMQEILDAYEVPAHAIVVHPEATRADIEAGFRGVIASKPAPEDRVLVYYSGHGTVHEDMGCLVPVDYHCSKPGDFRGVLAAELGLWFAQIFEWTQHVTWIADCCHATEVTRSTRKVKAIVTPPELTAAFKQHREALSGAIASLDVQVDPRIVRVCASAGHERAYEQTFPGGPGGVLTHVLAQCLKEIEHRPIECADLGRRVLAGIRKLGRDLPGQQTPVIHGPGRAMWLAVPATTGSRARRLFTTALLGPTTIRGGHMLGQRPGDRYTVLGDDGEALTEVVLADDIASDRAGLVPGSSGAAALPSGMTAILRRAGEPRGEFTFSGDEASRAALAAAVGARAYVRIVADETSDVANVGRVVAEAGRYTLLNWLGEAQYGATALEIAERLEDLARARTLVGLRSSSLAGDDYSVEWRPGHASNILEITSRTGVPLYASAFHVGSDGQIRLLNRRQPDGQRVDRQLQIACAPADLRTSGKSLGKLVVLVSEAKVDVRGWLDDVQEPVAHEPTRGTTHGSGLTPRADIGFAVWTRELGEHSAR